jgi:hypothetical protein
MAQVQTSTVSGEMALRFIQFVQMHAQNASFCLGRIGNAKPNLDMARLLIDQLAAIAVKTKGNLTADEETVLQNALTNLENTYAEVRRASPGAPGSGL